MSLGNKALRDNAIAFRADWWGNQTIYLDMFDDNSHMVGDLRTLTPYQYFNPTSYFPRIVPIRMTRPEQGQLISASLTLQITAPSNGGIGVRIASGSFLADGVTTTYDETKIAQDWRKLSGNLTSLTAAANNTLLIDGLNIMPIIPQRGDSGFNSDGFIILVVFDSAPAVDGNNTFGYKLNKFNVPCIAQLAVV